MIVLDTNVISALMKEPADHAVITWLSVQSQPIWTTSVSVFEIRHGLAVMDLGKRRRSLEQAFEAIIQNDLQYMVLSLDMRAALEAADIAAELRTIGRPSEELNRSRDIFIAGIVRAHGGLLATRNTKHFDHTSIDLVNPWA